MWLCASKLFYGKRIAIPIACTGHVEMYVGKGKPSAATGKVSEQEEQGNRLSEIGCLLKAIMATIS